MTRAMMTRITPIQVGESIRVERSDRTISAKSSILWGESVPEANTTKTVA
jgi:hypothetical protein